MTDTSVKSRASDGGLENVLDKLRDTASKNPAAERLLSEVQNFLAAQAERAVKGVGDRAGALTDKLTDVAEGNGNPGGLLGNVAKEMMSGAKPGKALLKGGLKGGLKNIGEKAKKLFGKGGGRSGGKSMNIIEDIDVGVPVNVAYNQWSAFEQFPDWSKGAQSVSVDDPVGSKWKAKVFWSNRNWNAKITEQIPDRRIAWTSDGPKGVVNGAVTFHPIGENLTKVLLALEYIPSGFFEKTGNLWRAQGRRARLDLKLFRKYVMTNTEAGEEGWRGEIRDSEVVREPEDEEKEAKEKEAKEQEAKEPEKEEDEEKEAKARDEEEPGDEDEDYDEEAEYDEDEEPEDEDEDYDEEAEYDEEPPSGEYEEEEEEEEEEARRPARAGR